VGDVLSFTAIHYVKFWIMYFIALVRGKTVDFCADVSGSRPIHKRLKEKYNTTVPDYCLFI
jgi:hypothetical protein